MNTPDDVAAVFERLVVEDVASLLADVRREGLDRARDQLAQAYADALVRAVGRRGCEPAPADLVGLCPPAPAPRGETGCYVYAVVAGDGTGAGADVRGIQPGGPVEVVAHDGIAAVVSQVDLDAMRAGGAAPDVDERGWFANAVRAHERVVLAAFHSAPTVPMRFGIVHPDREAVQRMLAEHADDLRCELIRFDGLAEWSVRVHVDQELVAASVGTDPEPAVDDLTAEQGGRDYLLRRRSQQVGRDRVRAFVQGRLDEIAQDLAAIARDSVLTTGASDGNPPAFGAAYLVTRQDESRLVSVVEALGAQLGGSGFSFEVGGPWPPYHFTDLRLEAEHA